MLIKKVENGYEFETSTVDDAFIVRLTLLNDGKEKLQTIPVGVPVSFISRELDPGTIQKAIGEKRWKNFERMKKLNVEYMFAEEHLEHKTTPF